jgi:hypothetical protein
MLTTEKNKSSSLSFFPLKNKFSINTRILYHQLSTALFHTKMFQPQIILLLMTKWEERGIYDAKQLHVS